MISYELTANTVQYLGNICLHEKNIAKIYITVKHKQLALLLISLGYLLSSFFMPLSKA